MDKNGEKEEDCVALHLDHEKTCWGCGLRLILSNYSPIFKCGWCGAITNQNKSSRKPDSICFSRWRHLRDWLFVTILIIFKLFVICAGVWAVYPTIFSISYFCGVFHCVIAAILSVCTFSSFCLAAFRSPGEPLNILWGSYPYVGKDGLENYTFCEFCAKPKPPRAHHCRSCTICVLDMDHHCPFIGNCVGASNHRSFILFLISVVVSCIYLTVMTSYAGYHVWPPIDYGNLALTELNSLGSMSIVKQIVVAVASSALLLPGRGIVLIYLTFASISVEIGISVLLWQQLNYIYAGNTYINHISSKDSLHNDRGCHNLLRFFGCPHLGYRFLLGFGNTTKLQESTSSKLL